MSFLKFGYFLDYKNPTYSFDYSKVDKEVYKNLTEMELIEIGSSLFMKSIENGFKKNQSHIVPISGGLDSRAVLAALLEFTDSTNIHTYTFGTPGTLDYDIGNTIATATDTKHDNFPLTDYVYSMEELLDISKRVDHQTVLFHHPAVWKLDEKFNKSIMWSGFFGGLTGSAYNKKAPLEINAAKKSFIKKNEYQRSISLQPNEDESFSNMLDIDFGKDNNQVTPTELLHFNNRQLKFIAPHVLMKGFNYQTPFLNQDLFNFFLSIDDRYREGQFLYKKILLRTFPKLFSYPIKDNAGLPMNTSSSKLFVKKAFNRLQRKLKRNYINSNVNYLDFERAIRQKPDLKKIIRENIHDLYNRKIIDWLDVRKVYDDHLNKNMDYGNALLLLSSLEIHMKSKEIHG
jgi:asparagine synthetase B (glutamine-hydrolysing)